MLLGGELLLLGGALLLLGGALLLLGGVLLLLGGALLRLGGALLLLGGALLLLGGAFFCKIAIFKSKRPHLYSIPSGSLTGYLPFFRHFLVLLWSIVSERGDKRCL